LGKSLGKSEVIPAFQDLCKKNYSQDDDKVANNFRIARQGFAGAIVFSLIVELETLEDLELKRVTVWIECRFSWNGDNYVRTGLGTKRKLDE
jgi:hypothetical protein